MSLDSDTVDRLCTDFSNGWKRGDRPKIEDYLAGVSITNRSELLVELVREEHARRREMEELPTLDEYQNRFPNEKGAVKQAFYTKRDEGGLQYALLRVLGEGGQAKVYLARDNDNDDIVAIKMYQKVSSSSRQRFDNELFRLKKAKHSLVVPVLNECEEGNRLWLVLDYISGPTLKEKLEKDGPFKPIEAARIMQRVAEAMEYVHTKTSNSGKGSAVVHRDLKPANIILDENNDPHIVDFGLAILAEELVGSPECRCGTFEYMSPEQAAAWRLCNGVVDHRTDVWALGAILFELLVGQPPFGKRPIGPFSSKETKQNAYIDFLEPIQRREVPAPAPRLLNTAIPDELDGIIQQCLAKDPSHRIQSAGDLAKQLKQWLDTVELLQGPYDFSAYLKGKLDHFSDRLWIFEEINAWAESSSVDRVFLLTGDFGTGKTTLMAQFVAQYAQQLHWPRVLAYHFCDFNTEESRRPARFIRSLAAMLRDKVPEYAVMLADFSIAEALSVERCETDPASSFEIGILAPLHKIQPPDDLKRYLVVDSLDESAFRKRPEQSIAGLLAPSIERLPRWLRLIVTTRPQPDILPRFSNALELSLSLHQSDERRVEAIREDAERYIRSRLADPNCQAWLQHNRKTEDEVLPIILERSEGNYLYLDFLFKDIKRNNVQQLPRGLNGWYMSSFDRLFSHKDKTAYQQTRSVLEIVLAAKEAPELSILQKVTGFNEYELRELLARLSDFLKQTVADQHGERYSLVHRSLAEWLTDRNTTTYFVQLDKGHERLADDGLAEWNHDPEKMSAYHLAFLITHLVVCSRWEELGNVLLDPAYLESRAKLPGLACQEAWIELCNVSCTLAPHIDDIGKRRVVQLFDDTLRSHTAFLGKYPRSLFQVCWNTLWWHDAPGTEQYYEPTGTLPTEHTSSTHTERPVSSWMEQWRAWKEKRESSFAWVRSLRPPHEPPSCDRVLLSGHDGLVVAGHLISLPPRVLTATSEGTLYLWEAERGVQLQRQKCGGNVTQVFLLPGGDEALLAFGDGKIILWDLDSRRVVRTLCPSGTAVDTVELSPNGRLAAAGITCRDDCDELGHLVRCWDIATGKVFVEFDTFLPAYLLTFSPSEEMLGVVLRGVSEETLRQCIGQEEAKAMAPIINVLGSMTVEAWALRPTPCKLWCEPCGMQKRNDGNASVSMKNVNAICFLEEHRLLAELYDPKETVAWDSRTGARVALHGEKYSRNLHGFLDDATALSTMPPPSTLLAVSEDRSLELVRDTEISVEVLRSNRSDERGRQRIGHDEYGLWIQVDDQRIAQHIGWGDTGVWRLWDWTSAKHLGRIEHPSGRHVIAVDAGVRKALVAGAGESLLVIDVDGPASISVAGDWGNRTCAAMSPCGSKVAVGMSDGTVWVSKPREGSNRKSLTTGRGPVAAVAFSTTGDKLLSVHGQLVRFWDLESCGCQGELVVSEGEVNPMNATFSPDGQRQVVWSTHCLWICDAKSKRELAFHQLRPVPENESIDQRVLTVPFMFTEGGHRLRVANGESIFTLDTRTGESIDGDSQLPIPRLRNKFRNESSTLILSRMTGKPMAAFPKFSRSGVVMPDGQTVVLEHARWGRLEILRLEGKHA